MKTGKFTGHLYNIFWDIWNVFQNLGSVTITATQTPSPQHLFVKFFPQNPKSHKLLRPNQFTIAKFFGLENMWNDPRNCVDLLYSWINRREWSYRSPKALFASHCLQAWWTIFENVDYCFQAFNYRSYICHFANKCHSFHNFTKNLWLQKCELWIRLQLLVSLISTWRGS